MSDEQGPGYSINVSGGEVQIGALAQGPNARASAVVTNVTEARDVAADLRRALQEAGAPHEAAAELETERELHASLLELLAQDLRAGRPERTRAETKLFLAEALRPNINRADRRH